MPGFLLHVGANVRCSHQGEALPATPNPKVLVDGQPTVALSTIYNVAGCTLPPPPAANGPCVTARWVSGATRVTSNGQPLLLQTGQAICAPTGTPLLVVQTQTRVTAI